MGLIAPIISSSICRKQVGFMSQYIRKARARLNQEMNEINGAWKGQEMVAINHAFTMNMSNLNEIASIIDEIERDIAITEQEIRREDEAAAAAARERMELERKEKERLEQEKASNHSIEAFTYKK